MSHYLVTGGAGFIGSHLVRRLLALGHTVRVLDNLVGGNRNRLTDVAGDLDFIEGDLRDESVCVAACRSIEVVFHQAALASVPRSIEDPKAFHEVNIDGTFRLLAAARQAGCRRVIYAASSSAYGDQPTQPKHEAMPPAPLSPYALTKLVGEMYARIFHACYGLETLSLRYFNVFGPHQDPTSQYAAAIPAFVSAILRGKRPVVYGDGEQTRDFTHIDNVVEANLLAATAPRATGQVLNIACGRSVTINEVIAAISRLLKSGIEPRHEPERPGDIRHSQADIALARREIGFAPAVMFEEGLARTIEWYRANL